MVNSAHDMGGVQSAGPVDPERDEPVFHHEWERRAFALTVAMGFHGRWNLDQARFAREDTLPADYLSRSYYEIWLAALERLIVEAGMVSPEEIEAALAGAHVERIAEPAVTAGNAAPLLAKGGSARMDDEIAPKFAVGQRVRVRNRHPRGHTRAPRYVRGHVGTVERDHGVFLFPDRNAADGIKQPQRVYAVRFDACELWGEGAGRRDSVCVDLWDDYLDPAP